MKTLEPREKTDLITYYIASCDRPGCEEVDLGIDQYASDAWNAYTAHCRDVHKSIVTTRPMIRHTTWEDAPANAEPLEGTQDATGDT